MTAIFVGLAALNVPAHSLLADRMRAGLKWLPAMRDMMRTGAWR